MAEILLHLEPWWRFGAALLIGALIGLEREFVQQRTGDPEFAGIRTFSLISLLGAVAAYLAERHGILLFAAPYLGLVILVGVSHFGAVSRGDEEGITTEVAGLLVPLLGAMVVWGPCEVLNPFEIWLLVVFVSGISFFGYVLMKLLGAEKSHPCPASTQWASCWPPASCFRESWSRSWWSTHHSSLPSLSLLS